MGVTIHWQGRLIGREAYSALIQAARAFADDRNWPIQDIEPGVKRLERVINEEGVDYEGPTSGVVVWPHPDCEPVRFEFDEDLFTQEYCKTQFAGADVHVAVVHLLRQVTPYFHRLEVTDEGEFWDLDDGVVLQRHFEHIAKVLAEMRADDPTAKSPVTLPSGRMLDIIGNKTN